MSLTFGKEGVAVYTAYEIPVDLNWTLVVVEADADVRAIPETLANVVNSVEFEAIAAEVINDRVTVEQNPAVQIIFEVSKFIAGKMGELLSNNKDEQIGLYIESLNRFEHYSEDLNITLTLNGIEINSQASTAIFRSITRYLVLITRYLSSSTKF